jgi:hypothetical protein
MRRPALEVTNKDQQEPVLMEQTYASRGQIYNYTKQLANTFMQVNKTGQAKRKKQKGSWW